MNNVIRELINKNNTKIVFCVLDGLGGLPKDGKTELEAADTPNLDELAKKSSCGLHIPVARGITPGSGVAHLALFGYDPFVHRIGRGVLEVLGLGVGLDENDLAIRGNFATAIYQDGLPVITDRRAGRIPTKENKRIVGLLSEQIKHIDGVKISFYSGIDHRFALKLTFPEKIATGGDNINDTDPQEAGLSPLIPNGSTQEALKPARVITKLISRIAEKIRNEKKANYVLLRGISVRPYLDPYKDAYGLKAGCIAAYPMYRGVAKLVGMEVLQVSDKTIAGEIETLKGSMDNYDFIYLHIKGTDSYGEDGNFDGKVGVIEEFDSSVPEIMHLDPDVLVVTGDHSTPSIAMSHSWHPVPIMINSKYSRLSNIKGFNETECNKGSLGIIKSTDIMPLLLAHSGRLKKFGA